MAQNNIPSIPAQDATRALPFAGHLAPPFEAVSISVERYDWGFCIAYRGTPRELAACGAVDKKLLASRYKNVSKVDADGDNVGVHRIRSGRGIEVTRRKKRGVSSLPGVQGWMLQAPVQDSAPRSIQPLSDMERTLARKYRGVTVEASLLRVGDGGQVRQQNLHLQEHLAGAIVRARLFSADDLERLEASYARGQSRYSEHGDLVWARRAGSGLYRVSIYTAAEQSSADSDRQANSVKLQNQVARLLRPLIEGTWTPTGKAARS